MKIYSFESTDVISTEITDLFLVIKILFLRIKIRIL